MGQRHVTVTEQRTAVDFAQVVRDLLEVRYPHAEKVVLVIDNLNTHKPAALYQAFEPAVARSLIDRLEIHYTPKHGSWLIWPRSIEHPEPAVSGSAHSRSRHGHPRVAAWEQARNANPGR